MAKYCFCGISGSGMSPLAQILRLKGHTVYGSDRSFDQGKDFEQKKALESLGIKMFAQDGSMIETDTDCLFVSTAIEDTIPDVKTAQDKNIKIQKRSDLLATIFHQYKYSIAVGGTSGKTTTTAMIGYVLDTLGQKPTVINGGLLQNYKDQKGIPNYIYNNGEVCVIEADESDGSIEKYHPYIGVINNISIDHKPIDELQELFSDFASRCDYGIVVNDDCLNSTQIKHHKNTIRFSTKNKNATLYAHNIKPIKNGISYEIENHGFTLNLIGEFNVSNALACIGVCTLMGIDKFDAATALEGFLGTKRRLELVGVKNDITVIDDFAHNPDKVKASVSALKDYKGRLIIMFQPHGFGAMRMMGKDIIQSYVETLGDDDILIMPEIFFAGGTVTKDISSKDLIDLAKAQGKKAFFFETRDEIKSFIIENAKKGDRIIIQGARDNTLPILCQEILKGL